VYNKNKNLFLSPFADGPIHFYNTIDGKMNIENITRFGRSFSILRIPYALKLLIQELQVMNVQMRLITDDNVDQLVSMSYSKNIMELTKKSDIFKDIVPSNKETNIFTDEDTSSNKETKVMNEFVQNYIRYVNMDTKLKDSKIDIKSKIETLEEEPESFEIVYPETPDSLTEEEVERKADVPPPTTPDIPPPPTTPELPPPSSIQLPSIELTDDLFIDFGNKEYNDFYQSLPINSRKMIYNLPERDRLLILKKTKLLKEQKMQNELQSTQPVSETINPEEKKSPFEYTEEKPIDVSNEESSNNNETNSSENNSNNSEVKKITI
jgi:hypothetical protein